MFDQFLNNKKLRNKIHSFFVQHNEQLFDIIIFGSLIRGKEKPADIDILLLFKNKENIDIVYSFRNQLKSFGFSLNVIAKTYSSLLSPHFNAREAILGEGYSLITNNFLASSFGYSSFILFKLSLVSFTQSQRMRFHYSLYGRYNSQGMLKKLKLIKFSDSILLSPITSAEETKEYLSLWNIAFQEFPVLLPFRVGLK
jgi:predicted nucleotidyltransferase